MDNLLNFLNTLLGIEVSIFGVISAVILVFIQLVYTNYTYKHIGHLLRNIWLILFFVCSALDLILTASGTFFLNIASSNPATGIFTNPWYLLICLLLIFISISFFVTLIVENISYLQPHRAIFLLSKSFRFEYLRDYFWKKYPLEPPYELKVRIVFDIANQEDPQRTEEERIAELKSKETENDRKLATIEKQIKAIEKRIEKAEDPLLPIRDMMIQFIRRVDLSSLTEAHGLLISVSKNFIENIPESTSQEWSPNAVLFSDFTQYLIELLSTLLEIAENQGLESAKKVILNVGYGYASVCFEKSAYSELDKVHKFFQNVADQSIGKSSIIFQNIMEHYQYIGEKIFDLLIENPEKKPDNNYQEAMQNIFRYVGWLGERLLMRVPIEASPLMRNYDYSTEYEALFNCLLSFEDRYRRDQPGAYPLIYFDALFVVLMQLVKINRNTKIRHLDENIYDIVYAFASFAEEAIKMGNSDGAALAALRVKEAYDEIKQAGIDNLANDAIKTLVRIGMLAAGNKEMLHTVDFMSKSLDSWAADTLIESREYIESAVLDAYIHTYEVKNLDAKWDFITKLGVRMGTNFGLAFDPLNGKSYPEDDSRRQ
jgi:hypothetical protein